MFNWISGTTIVCNEIFFSNVIEIFPYRGDRAEKIEFIQNVQLWTDFLASILFIVGKDFKLDLDIELSSF